MQRRMIGVIDRSFRRPPLLGWLSRRSILPDGSRSGGCFVAIVGAQFSLWEALAGRAPGQPIGHADPGLWQAVAERLNPARARPHLRKGIEHRTLATAR